MNVAQGIVVSIKRVGFIDLLGMDVAAGQPMPAQSLTAPLQSSAAVNPITENVLPVDPTQATPTPTPAGAMVLLDTYTNATAFSITSSVPHTYMGDGFMNTVLPGGTTYFSIRSYDFFMASIAATAYTDIHARMQFWSTYVQTATAVNQFSNPAGFFDVDLGAFTTAASSFYQVTITVLTPFPFFAGGASTQWGYVQNFQGNVGAGLVDDTNLTSIISSCATCAGVYASGQITTGTAPNYGYYRNASSETNFNFLGTSSRTLGLVTQGIAVIIRGDPHSGATPTPAATGTPGPTPTPGTPAPTASPTPTATPPNPVCNLPSIGFEDFADITTLVPGGWIMTNHSTAPVGNNWFQGNTASFPSQAGAANAYVAANYQSTAGGAGTETISNWLLLPPLSVTTGFNGQMSFWTRTVDTPTFPDRLQVRLSTAGNGSDVGVTPTDVGTFTTVLADINPTYTTSGYPNVWTNYVVTLPSLPTGTVRLAFRYFVENGGPAGVNSDFIGIDTVTYKCQGGFATPTPSPTPTATPTPSPTSTPGPNGCQWGFSTVVPIPILDNAVTVVGSNLYSFGGVVRNHGQLL